MFEWNNSYSVGIVGIDAQHRTLFGLGAELYTAMAAGQGKAVCAKILDRLIQYTASHFAYEERLLRQSHYPEFVAHKAEHDALTKQVLQFQADLKAGQATITVQLLQFLKNWLERHIKSSDVGYAPFLISKQMV